MIILAISVGFIISEGDFFLESDRLVLSFFAALLIQASTFALNDYFDLDLDRKNKRYDRPLVRGDVSPKTALLVSLFLLPTGIALSIFINIPCFLIALISALLGVLYDAKLKHFKPLGNLYIAYTMAIPFIFGSFVTSREIPIEVLILSSIAFLAGTGREIMKDIIDEVGDREKGVISLPIILGSRFSSRIISFLYILAIVLSIYPFFLPNNLYYMDYLYISLLTFTDVVFLFIAINLMINKITSLEFYRKATLLAMTFALFTFLIAAIY